MVRRPIFVLSILLLCAAAVQAAVVAFTQNAATQPGGEICTACGPIAGDQSKK